MQSDSNRFNSDILFYHIPKAAGNSLFQRLSTDLEMDFINFRSINKNHFNNLLLSDKKYIWTAHPSGGFKVWNKLLSSKRTFKKITMLRKPLNRYTSEYFYNYRSLIKNHTTLEDTLTRPVSEHYMVDNIQTKIIAANGTNFDYSTHANDNLLKKAKINLIDNFICFGLVEYFDISYLLLSKYLNFKPKSNCIKANVNPCKDYMNKIPQKLRDRIEAHNIYDLELYRFACELFMARIQSSDLQKYRK